MAKNLIYLCKSKLGDLDGILPILMEVKMHYPGTNIAFVFHSDKHLREIKRNHNLWIAIQSMKSQVFTIRDRNNFVTVARLINFLLKFLFKDNIILRQSDVLPYHNGAMKFLRRFSNLIEIKTYLSIQSLDLARNFHVQSSLARERRGADTKSSIFNGRYDYFLFSFDPVQFKKIIDDKSPMPKMINAGYTRRLAAWQEYINAAIKENKTIAGDAYFLYILAYTEKRCDRFEEPEVAELLEETLTVLKKYNKKIKTIFKPHAKTDLKKVENILRNINYSNYIIDYSHPFILSSKAKFIIGNIYSCTMFDAFYQGIPVVEYCQYDPELFNRLQGQSLGGKHCDFFIHRDKKMLDEVLNMLINGEVKVERDPDLMQSSYPATPREFYDFWETLLSEMRPVK